MRILCVEDDLLNRKVIANMLGVAGIEMVEADDAQTGLALVEAEDLSAVLMDLRMPGLDGLWAIRRIRGLDGPKAELPVIVLTAETGAHVLDECLAAGADALLHKPVAMARLFASIGECMAKRAR